MVDDRTYIRLHDGFDENHKIVGTSDKEFRTYIEALCYCSRNLSDGFIPFGTSKKLATPRVWRALVESGLMEDHSEGYVVHDYLEHQRSAEQVKQYKEAKREAGRKGGKARAAAQAEPKHVLEQTPKQTASKSNPEAEAETEEKKTTSSLSDDSDDSDLFAEFWKHYPRKDSKQDAMKAWKQVTKSVKPAVIVEAVQAYPFKPERNFQPLPGSWLRGRRWEDEAVQLPLEASGQLTSTDVQNILGPDHWTLPRPPLGLSDADEYAWEQRIRREHLTERQQQARARMGRTA